MRRARSFTVGLVVLVTGACSREAPPQESNERVCGAAEQLTVALDIFDTTLTPQATVDDVAAARDGAGQAWRYLNTAAGDMAQERTRALDEAWNRFDVSVDRISESAITPDVARSLRDDAVEVQQARNALADNLGC
ncbi:hypothetical protein [Promicromonospora iranensis]|uniref:Lipoprotein n=1 Tax=Promicromonospora iranensis TaxID=1105144 RepID=A0ABU2CIM9_9MICO|nr:hypothetical protein [Promicromonospora iranensis]MDR7381195.1 hypothetical protein [Promicromonospora iranensis]